VVLEPLNGLLVANPLEGFLGRLEVGVELSDQVAQGMLQHSAGKLTLISSRESDVEHCGPDPYIKQEACSEIKFTEIILAKVSRLESQSWVSF
jgi:hypothetical protein